MQLVQATPLYYGKSPAYGDFLRVRNQHALIIGIDQWITEALELSMQQPEFTKRYSELPSLDFFIAHPQGDVVLAANLIASEDSSGRRFPMVLGYLFEGEHIVDHLNFAPCLLNSVLQTLSQRNRVFRTIHQQDVLLDKLNKISHEVEIQTVSEVADFFENQTMHSFAELMEVSVYTLSQQMMALGMLLQPVLRHGTLGLNKVLIFPVGTGHYTFEVSAFWLGLIQYFLQDQRAEVFFCVQHSDTPLLLFGFQGADISALSDIIIQNLNHEKWIDIADAEWINPYLEQNAGLAALEQFLCERQLSLVQGMKLFRQYFTEEAE